MFDFSGLARIIGQWENILIFLTVSRLLHQKPRYKNHNRRILALFVPSELHTYVCHAINQSITQQVYFYETLPTSKAATPSSSLLTVIFVVTPLFAEYAIFTNAATLPPLRVLPYSLSVWVLVERVTSVPSSGWRDRAFVSCSVASTA